MCSQSKADKWIDESRTNGGTYIYTDRQTYRQTYRQTEKHTQIDESHTKYDASQMDRQINERQTESD